MKMLVLGIFQLLLVLLSVQVVFVVTDHTPRNQNHHALRVLTGEGDVTVCHCQYQKELKDRYCCCKAELDPIECCDTIFAQANGQTFDCGGGGRKGGCFSSTATVFVEDEGPVAMKDLKIGDRILVSDNNIFEPVYAFGHYEPDIQAQFLNIQSKDTSYSSKATIHTMDIQVTPEHLIYLKNKANPVRADSIQIGDYLDLESTNYSSNSNSTTNAAVHEIQTITQKGLFAPFTKSGTIMIVNSNNNNMLGMYIKASSYIGLQPNNKQHASVEFVTFRNGISTGISQHTLIHMALSPFRMICSSTATSSASTATAAFCHSYNPRDGMPYYVSYGLQLAEYIQNQCSMVTQILFFVLFVIIFGAMWMVEQSYSYFYYGAYPYYTCMFYMMAMVAVYYAFARSKDEPNERLTERWISIMLLKNQNKVKIV